MRWQLLLAYGPLLAALTGAAVVDLRHRRIPNWLNLAIAVMGITLSFTASAVISPFWAVVGLLTGLFLSVGLFIIGARGGGDVKLLAALGAWLGPVMTLEVFILSALISLALVLLQCAIQKRLSALFRNTAVLAGDLIVERTLTQTNIESTTVGRPIPFALSALLAVSLVLLYGRGLL